MYKICVMEAYKGVDVVVFLRIKLLCLRSAMLEDAKKVFSQQESSSREKFGFFCSMQGVCIFFTVRRKFSEIAAVRRSNLDDLT